jgi:hypothetical protein
MDGRHQAPGGDAGASEAVTLPAIARVPMADPAPPFGAAADPSGGGWHPRRTLGSRDTGLAGEVPVAALTDPPPLGGTEIEEIAAGQAPPPPTADDADPAQVDTPGGKFGPRTPGRRAAIAAAVAIPLVTLAVVLVTHRSSGSDDTTPVSDSTSTSSSEPATPDPAPSDQSTAPPAPGTPAPGTYPSDAAVPGDDPAATGPQDPAPPPPPPLPNGPVSSDQLPGGPPMAVPPDPPPPGDPGLGQPPGQAQPGQAQPEGSQNRVRFEQPRDSGSADRAPRKTPPLGRNLDSITKSDHRSGGDDSDDSGRDGSVSGGLRPLGGGL